METDTKIGNCLQILHLTRLDWMNYLPFLLLLGLFLAVALSRRKAGLIVVPGLGRLDRLQIGTYETSFNLHF